MYMSNVNLANVKARYLSSEFQVSCCNIYVCMLIKSISSTIENKNRLTFKMYMGLYVIS